ncbi:MAG: YqgE/AlgH family protein [Pirellulales bacterium]
MKSLTAHFLIASSELVDPNFFRTVVLIFRHNEEGAAGVILNRRMTATVKQIWEQVSEESCECEAPLHMGGPVEGPLMALHGDEGLSEMTVLAEVYVSTGREMLEKLVEQNHEPLRFFVGYAGWGSGQLERELRDGSWLAAPATAEQVFGAVDDLWQQLTRSVVSRAFITALNIKHVPPDPSLN